MLAAMASRGGGVGVPRGSHHTPLPPPPHPGGAPAPPRQLWRPLLAPPALLHLLCRSTIRFPLWVGNAAAVGAAHPPALAWFTCPVGDHDHLPHHLLGMGLSMPLADVAAAAAPGSAEYVHDYSHWRRIKHSTALLHHLQRHDDSSNTPTETCIWRIVPQLPTPLSIHSHSTVSTWL